MPLCGARGAQRVGEDESLLLDVYGKTFRQKGIN